MQISPCPIALPLGKLSALAGVKFIAAHCSATRPTAIICLLLTGCATMQVPVCPEVTLKLCPAVTK